jgi:hypothetical protein
MYTQNNSNFNIEEKIFAFMDGELPDSDEAELISILAKEKYYRTLFKFHLNLKNSYQVLKSYSSVPQDVDKKISEHLSKIKPVRKQRIRVFDAVRTALWQRKFSMNTAFAIASCILIVIGTLIFSKILPSTRMQYIPQIRIENISEIQEIRKHIPKVKLTIEDRVE